MALAHHADEQGRCWPSQVLIAEEAGTTQRTVRRVMRQLHKLGIVTSARRFNRSTLYTVQFNADVVSSLSGRSVRMNSTRTSKPSKRSQLKPRLTILQPCGLRHAYGIGCLDCFKLREAERSQVSP